MSAPTFTIAADGRSITCLLCHWTSFHPEDVAQHYCGHCHIFHDDRDFAQPLETIWKRSETPADER